MGHPQEGLTHRPQQPTSEDKPKRRTRVFWSSELKKRFEGAVGELGIDQATPKQILRLMNVEGLTRENVASHLQKYRAKQKRAEDDAKQKKAGCSHPGSEATNEKEESMGDGDADQDMTEAT